MIRFYNYLQEKYSIVTLCFLVFGLSLSGLLLNNYSIQLTSLLFSIFGLTLFFFIVPIIEDLKELSRLKRDFPEKSFHSLLSLDELIFIMNFLQSAMFLFSLLTFFVFSIAAGTVYLIISVYLWDIHKDFYIRRWLKQKFFIKGLLCHLIYFPVALFPIALSDAEAIAKFSSLSYSFMIFAIFFCYTICERLDPQIHPRIQTYVHYYGFHKVFYACSILLIFSAFSAQAIGLQFILWPVELALFFSLCAVFIDSTKFKFAEQTAKASLLIHTWAIVIMHAYLLVRK